MIRYNSVSMVMRIKMLNANKEGKMTSQQYTVSQ